MGKLIELDIAVPQEQRRCMRNAIAHLYWLRFARGYAEELGDETREEVGPHIDALLRPERKAGDDK